MTRTLVATLAAICVATSAFAQTGGPVGGPNQAQAIGGRSGGPNQAQATATGGPSGGPNQAGATGGRSGGPNQAQHVKKSHKKHH